MIISFKTKTNLISELLKQENIVELKKQSIFSKIVSRKQFSDIYFHSGILNNEAIRNIENAKVTIVNSENQKHQIISELNLDSSKIKVIYPSIDIKYEKPKEIKKQFCEKYNIDRKKKILLFRAKNFKTSGIREFFQIVTTLKSDNFQILISGDKNQIMGLKFQIKNLNLQNNITLIDDLENSDELFLASDIFLLPTYNRGFSTNIIKAMFCKCAVFIPISNYASELVDIFATMDNPNDPSTIFKVDALLQNKDDLKLIKNQNRQKALEFTLEKNLSKINEIIFNI